MRDSATDARILCRDRRLARLLELELATLGLTSRVTAPPSDPTAPLLHPDGAADCRLLLVDLDALPPSREISLPATCATVAWSRRADRLPAACPPSSGAVFTDPGTPARHIFLRRPFALEALEQAVRVCLGDQPTPALPCFRVTDSPVSTGLPETPSPHRQNSFPYPAGPEGVVQAGDRTLSLSPHEWTVFLCLWENRGEVVSRDTLRGLLGSTEGNMVEVYICHLRDRLEKPLNRRLITTVRGKGYRMEKEPD